ncbi:MAG: hypothetical protein ABFS05_04725 [Bacteroidota bacterium]
MKKLLLLSGIILALSFAGNTQNTASDIYKADHVTWYGLDFSNVKLVGSAGFTNPSDIKYRFFKAWNGLFMSEPDKYNVAKFFHLNSVKNDISIVSERNELPDVDELVVENSYSFDKEKVKSIIAEYNTAGNEGIGLVFIMESFNKYDEQGYIWVTFFDIATKEVLHTEHFGGKPGGFGIRNYWARSYYNVMVYIDRSVVKRWKKEFQSN